MQVTLANWRTAPFHRWAFHHLRELVPSADIPHDPARVRALPAKEIDFKGIDLETFLRETDTDGMAILHRGRLVFEHHANGMTDETPHILMSVSKSLLGLLVEDLGIDATRRVPDFIPELESTAYRKATGWNPLAQGEKPSDLKSFYQKIRETGPHGGRVHYVSPNSDLLGWVVERATGRRYAELMSERVWKKVGAERSAYITLDRLGAPRCAGGMCVTLRDLARVGQWLIETRSSWLESLALGGPDAWTAGDLAQYYPGLPMRYRSQWYRVDGEAPLVFGLGIHGQNLFIDRANEVVIAKFSSQAAPLDAARIGLTMRAVSQLRKFLA